MVSFNKKMSLVLSLLLFLSVFSSPVAYASNDDMQNHWAAEDINRMIEEGYLDGYPDGSFKPDQEMTRAQFVKVINKIFGFTDEGDIPFDDVKTDDWFYRDIRLAFKAGYIKGISLENFGPNDVIKRQDAAVILARILGLEEDASYCDNFEDKSLISDYARGAVGAIAKAGIMIGYNDKTFNPKKNITRAEVIVAERAKNYADKNPKTETNTAGGAETKDNNSGGGNNSGGNVVPTISIKDGMTQPIFDATKSIYETVFVEVPCDTDKDGKQDLVEVWIRRPQETSKGMKVPVILESSPYRNGVGDSPNHDVLGEQKINKDTSNYTYDDVKFKGMTAADWNPNAQGIPKARASNGTAVNGTERKSFNTSWYTYFASRGYAILYSASIGNLNSDGFVNCGGEEETLVCKTVIEWLNGKAKAYTNRNDNVEVKADWSTGNVAMTGISYPGTLPIATAATGVEGLKTIIPVAGISSWYDSYRYGGAVLAPDGNQGEDLDSVSVFSFSRENNPDNYTKDVESAWKASLAKMNEDFDRATGDYNSFWDERNYLKNADKIKASVLIVAGLNDWNVKPKHFDELWRACEKYNIPNKMILHQGQHIQAFNLQGLDYMTKVNKWLDHWLYGIENDWNSMSDVTIQNNKDLSWQGFDEWPVNDTSKKLYFKVGEENATGSLSETAPVETTETFKDTYLVGEKLNTESSNIINWTDYIVGASEPDKAISDRILYLTSELTEDIRLSGTTKINLDMKVNVGKGTLSAMIVDYGRDLRPSSRTSTVIAGGIDYGGGGGKANIVNFTLNDDTEYKVVTRGWADVQNPNPSGKIYTDAENTSFVPEYYYQTVKIEPDKYYNYAFCLEPMDYIFKAGHRIGIMVYSNDAQYTTIPEEKTQFTVELGEKSYIELPIDKNIPSGLNKIEIVNPGKTEYTVGDELDLSGINVKAVYENGQEKTLSVEDLKVTGFDSSKPVVDQVITVGFGGRTTTYKITVNAVEAVTMNTLSYYKLVNKGANGSMDSYKGDSIVKWHDYATNPSPDGKNEAAKWKFIEAGNSYYKIIAKLNGNYVKASGDSLALAADSNDDSVLWRVEKKGDYYIIVNKGNGNVLTASGSENDDPIEQKPYVDSDDNQLWTATIIEEIKNPDDPGQSLDKLVKHVNVITKKEIEVKFNNNVTNADMKDDFEVYVDGAKTTDFEFLSYFDNMATLRLTNSIDPAVNVIKVKIVDKTISDGTNTADLSKTYTASNVPYYTVQDIGKKSKIVVRASKNVSLDIVKQVSEGINKMVGRSEFMTLEAAKQGLTISIVGDNESVYMIPEYRELYNLSDAFSRFTIPGTVQKPIIVTTAADAMRKRGSDEYAMVYDFAKLFLESGVKVGALNTPLGPVDDPDLYNIYKHLKGAYDNAKTKSMWQNGMTSSIEEYFAKGTMIYYEVTPESSDGSWSKGIGPVSTRLELKEYDRALFDVFVEVYGEFEYISPYDGVTEMPWFVGTQANRYGIDGKELPAAKVNEVNLISGNQVEIKFNREVRNAEDKANYKVIFTPTGKEPQAVSDFSILPYAWDTVTLQFGGWNWNEEKSEWEYIEAPNFLTGDIGTDINGEDLLKGQYINATTTSAIAGKITVEVIGGGITDWSGNSVAAGTYDVVLKPHLGQVKRTDKVGAYVYADTEVSKESVEIAAGYIDEILSNPTYGQGIADGLNKQNAGLAIIAYGNHAYMQPDLRGQYGQFGLYVEGFGGGVAQTTEANINRNKKVTRYDNEFILGHEFGHSIHLTGIEASYPDLYKEIETTYQDVVKVKGLWPNSYAGGNTAEYFATLSDIWHSTMRESTDGTWNGTWGPVNTREELYRYDIKGYELMKKIYYSGSETDDNIIKYEKEFVGTPWESYTASNVYDIDCSKYNSKSPVISNAKFNGLTRIVLDSNKPLDGIKAENIKITKKSGNVVKSEKITKIDVQANTLTVDIDINEFANETSYGTKIEILPFGSYEQSNATSIEINGDSIAKVLDRITTDNPGNNSLWHNLGEDTAIKANPDPIANTANGEVYNQIGDIRGLMIVVDFPDAKAENNTGVNGKPGETTKDYGNKINGHELKTAQDYYDWLIPRAKEFYSTSSYGQLDLKVDLIKNPNNPTGAYTCKNSLYGGLATDDKGHTGYSFERNGDVDSYLAAVVPTAKNELMAAAGEYDIIYIVAVENAVGISYGPMDTWGGTANEWSGRTDLKAMVRIGNDTYTAWKSKAINHETGHAIGSPDYYINAFSGPGSGQCDPVTGKADYYPYVGHWDLMGYINGPAPDMFSWMKWRLGWIRDDQVDIIDTDGTTTHQLSPVEVPGGTKTVAIVGEEEGVFYVVENRQIAGVDNTAVTEKSTDPDPNNANDNWTHNYGSFNSPGILMYKIDANVPALSGGLTIVELNPEQTTSELAASLDKSVLGVTSGVYEYTDKAAGVTVKLINETNSINTITVTKKTPTEKVKPVLSDVRFIDSSTIEFRTDEDLRGITANKIIVKNGEQEISGVKINQILPRSMRITFSYGQFKEGDTAKIMIEAFMFYGDSEEVISSALISNVNPVLSEGKFNSLTEIEIKSDINLKGIAKDKIAIVKKDGTIVASSNISAVSFDETSNKLIVTLKNTQFAKSIDTEGVTLNTMIYSDFKPDASSKVMAQFNPPVIVTGASSPTAIAAMDKGLLQSIEITSEPYKKYYATGDEINLTGLKVIGTYSSDASTGVLNVTKSDVTGFDSSKAEENQVVTVKIGEETDTFNVTITEKPDKIYVDLSSSYKVNYYVGEELDISGLIVRGDYITSGSAITGSAINISIVDITGFDSSAASDSQTLTITYGGVSTTYDISIKVKLGEEMDTNAYYKFVNKSTAGLIDSWHSDYLVNWWDYASKAKDVNAQYKFIDSGDFYYKIMARSNEKYIAVSGNDLILTQDSNDDSLLWRVKKEGNYYILKNKANGNVITGNGSANDSRILQNTYTGANNQLWKFTILDRD